MTAPGVTTGITLATRCGASSERLAELAARAEAVGFSAVLLAEGGSDVLAPFPALAQATRRVTLGTAIANAFLHPPALTAMTVARLDDSTEGRFVLGLGAANPVLNHDQLGLPRTPVIGTLAEYVALVRAVHTGRAFEGRIHRVAPALVLDRPPRRPVPIHLAALRPRMLELAGKVADGVLLTLMSPAQVAEATDRVRTAAAAAGRDPATVRVTAVVQTCLSEDPERAATAARAVAVRFALHRSAARLFAENDPQHRMDTVRAALVGEDLPGAAAAVDQQTVDAFVVHGDAATCRRRLCDYRVTGVDSVAVFPMPVAGEWHGVLEAAVDAFGPDVAAAAS